MLKITPQWFRRFYPNLYILMVRRMPWLWSFGYHNTDKAFIFWMARPFLRLANCWVCRRLKRELKQSAPAVILTTHFLPADAVGAWKKQGWLRSRLIVSVTDYHPHRFWLIPEAEGIVVSTEEGAGICRQRGLRAEQVKVLGIPTSFLDIPDDGLAALRAAYNLHPEYPLLLLMSGGTTIGRFKTVVKQLIRKLKAEDRVQIAVVCGQARWTLLRLRRRAKRAQVPIQVFGFVERLGELMRIADLLIGKAGGLTISEALNYGTPMIFYHTIPGQEESNALHICRHGAGLILEKPEKIAERVLQLFNEREELRRMRTGARAIAHPRAADDILEQLVEPHCAHAA